jgi:hypothetical protein
MPITKDHPDNRHQLDTAIGRIDAWAQDGRTFLVRVGDGNELDPLDLGRGITITVHAHFKHKPGKGWCVWSPTYQRTDQRRDRDLTTAQARRASETIAEALGEFAGSPAGLAMLAVAQLESSSSAAAERTALALKLREVADHLDREAVALTRGGRVSYRNHELANGMTAKVQQIELSDGSLMSPCPEPPTVYGASRYGLAHVKRNTEEN